MLIQILWAIIILATAIPLGMLLEKITRDEKVFRRNFSKIAILASLIFICLSLIFSFENKLALIFTLIYVIIVCFISLKKR